eukprot:TRINITY_DN43307_c0_g1_i1.p1 TRINITY_DN43307_c0_g1~~TRINITY_DN43307_c0_g1_i1.p1  ORF type:complete len:278 (-),score=74.07 TRINITY_DN43307_c0_g1_i1:32-865(-)
MQDHGESIYNIIPPKSVAQEKPSMYRSKHSPRIPPSASTFHQKSTTNPLVSNLGGDFEDKVISDKSVRTMGLVPGSQKSTPRDYIRKTQRNGQVQSLSEVKRSNPEVLQPSQLKPKLKGDVPTKDEEPVMGLVSNKNFVVANAVEAILAAPKKVSQGAKEYLHKEDYGKVPRYLQHIKKDIEAEYDYIRQLEQQREDMNRSQVRPLDEEERQSMIDGLKAKWEAVNTEYQATTHLTKLDTIGKTKRKEKYEAELSQIEKGIEKLNRKNILVNAGYEY